MTRPTAFTNNRLTHRWHDMRTNQLRSRLSRLRVQRPGGRAASDVQHPGVGGCVQCGFSLHAGQLESVHGYQTQRARHVGLYAEGLFRH